MTRTIETDVLVIGGGGAGLRAAIETARQNARVLIVARSVPGKARTTMAERGANAALGDRDPEDSMGCISGIRWWRVRDLVDIVSAALE